ncbi:MAG TPA: 6-phosphofructokinase, partial [Solirubrobacterales bacterium]|nr:6-phosphofructokinase [Solirubrobacterales bacterium]
ARELESLTGFESRCVILGHIQRGGTPTARDRVLATRYGVKAYEMAKAGEFGRMAALRGDEITSVHVSEVDGVKQVPLELLELAKRFYD